MNPSVASRIIAPSSTVSPTSSDYGREPTRLADTGTTETSNSRALKPGTMATLVVGAEAVRVTFRADPGVSTAVATTDLRLPADSSFTWTVDPLTRYVYVEAADGAAVYEVWLWRSST